MSDLILYTTEDRGWDPVAVADESAGGQARLGGKS
jgi:hypothetical protein